MNKINSLFGLLPIIFLIGLLLLVLKPALSLPLPGITYVDLEVIVVDFGQKLNIFHPPLKYFVYHYGTQFTSILIAYKLFGFNPAPWFLTDIFLRITAAVTIYLFVVRWTNSKLAGILAGIFFGVNLAGLQPTTRVAFFLVYGAVISLFVFLHRWFRFHTKPTEKNLNLSVLFFTLAILTYPIRMVGTVPLLLIGELYWLIKALNERTNLKLQMNYSTINGGVSFRASSSLNHSYPKHAAKYSGSRIKHILLLIIITLSFVYITGTLSSTPELSFKRISPTMLLNTLLTGYPPVITALWIFISNLIMPPASFLFSSIDMNIFKYATLLLSLLAVTFAYSCILRRKFLLAFASLTVITFPFFVGASSSKLTGWGNNLIIATQIGGSIFILSNLFLLFMANKYKQLSGIGILGSVIVLSFLLFPWLISPEISTNDQSAFNFIHRYYTIPSAGMGLLLASVTALSFDHLKKNLQELLEIKNLFLLPVLIFLPLLIIFSVFWNILSTNNFLSSIGGGADATKIELFWNKIDPLLKELKAPPAINYIYINNTSRVNNKYITEMIADRIKITRKQIYNPPKITLIFTQREFTEILNKKNSDDKIFSFQFDGQNVIKINEN